MFDDKIMRDVYDDEDHPGDARWLLLFCAGSICVIGYLLWRVVA